MFGIVRGLQDHNGWFWLLAIGHDMTVMRQRSTGGAIGNGRQAVQKVLQKALSLFLNLLDAGKAWVLGILGRRDEALAAVNRALELDPEYFEAVKRKRRLEVM